MKLFPAKCNEHCEIAKTMTSNGKKFTVTREMLTALARDQRWPDVVAGIAARFSKFALVLFCYITNHLITNSLFPSGPVIKCLLFIHNSRVYFVACQFSVHVFELVIDNKTALTRVHQF